MAPLPIDRPPTKAELATLTLDEVRADPFLSKALADALGRQPEQAAALAFYEASLKQSPEAAAALIAGAAPELRLNRADLPVEVATELRAALTTRNTSTLARLVRETREGLARRFAAGVLPAVYASEGFERAVLARIARATADPVGVLLTALDAPAERWEDLRALLTSYRKDALLRDKNLKPSFSLPAWARTEKAMLQMIKLVPRVKLEPVLRKYKVPYVKPLLLDPAKLARALEFKEQTDEQADELREWVTKFNRLGKTPLEQVKLVTALGKLAAARGEKYAPEEVYKRMKLAKKT